MLVKNAMRTITAYLQTQRQRFLTELCEFVRLPSVSGQPEQARDVAHCASWLAAHLQKLGLEQIQIIPTPRHPLVYAAWHDAPTQPTVLIYGHYDVQPADPLYEWRTPPFTPTVRNGYLYGRGASDDKGQLFCHVKALEAYLKTTGRLPVNVICLFEGEEEIGSPNLKPWLLRHQAQLQADVAVISDTRFLARGRPALTYGLRGGLGLALTVGTLPRDVHSGSYGGALYNPIQVLGEIIAALHDRQGRIAIPGFYDNVRRWSQAERAFMRRQGPSDAAILQSAGARLGWGEAAYTLYERTTIRPALTINGITGGYQGPGGKGIIPAQASAKISFRLVPDQEPHVVEQLVRHQIDRLTPPGVKTTVTVYQRTKPGLIDRRHPAMQAAVTAYQRGFGATPVFLRSGGSIPVVNTLQEVLGIPTVLMGFALPDDRMHAPNERFQLAQFYGGVRTCIHFLEAVGQMGGEHQAERMPVTATR